MQETQKLQAVGSEANAFHRQFQSLQLATVSAAGMPEASYATFVEHEHHFYIYVSELAAHCANLQQQGRGSVMFIESEQQASHPFARKRLVLQCTAQEVPRDSATFTQVMDKFHDKFGQFMDVIARLTDFHLYALTPVEGSYVAGFAKAYRLTGQDLSEVAHRNEQGHRPPDKASQAAMDELV
jgi:putative heme iron utilization protein